jgi:crossover junction endodeoxyribonuclease RuvC
MIVLGIDPGLATLGYGAVDYDKNKLKLIDYGVVTTPADMPLPQRLKNIYDDVSALIEHYGPRACAVEELFFNKNAKTALTIGHARGVAILAAANNAVPVYEYTPLQIKQGITGYGMAQKLQVQRMVRLLLCMDNIPKPDDAADALAAAICCCYSESIGAANIC